MQTVSEPVIARQSLNAAQSRGGTAGAGSQHHSRPMLVPVSEATSAHPSGLGVGASQ